MQSIAGLNNPKVSNFVLWILAELAVVACDIPEGIENIFQLLWRVFTVHLSTELHGFYNSAIW